MTYRHSRLGGFRQRWVFAAVAALAAAMLGGCGSDEKPVYEERPVASLYNVGLNALAEGDYVEAATQFEEVERQHPFSIWAPRAQVMSAYAYFEADRYDDAIINIDRFIQLHPNHQDAPYAYYLKALAYYEQIVDVQRDQSVTAKALQALDDVQRRFPGSAYARDASLKRDLAFDHLAGKEMAIGRFYLRRGKPLAAINRFRSVLRNYQTTTHTPEALHRLVEAYTALGLKDEAKKTAAVLGHNFPGSPWYSDSYYLLTGERITVKADYDNRDWIERTWDYLLVPNHSLGAVDLDGEPQRVADLTSPPDNAGPTFASLGGSANQTAEADASSSADGAEVPAAAAASAASQAQAPALAAGQRPQVQSQLEKAESQAETARQAAEGWRKAAENSADGQQQQRAANRAEVAEGAAGYWQARADLLQLALDDPDNADAKRAAEKHLAEEALDYWRTVERLGETETERSLAAQNADAAEKALTYWNDESRGWLSRLFGGR